MNTILAIVALGAAVVAGNSIVACIIWLVVAGLIYWLLNWALGAIGLPEPFNKLARVLLILIVVVICINAVLILVGHPLITFG